MKDKEILDILINCTERLTECEIEAIKNLIAKNKEYEEQKKEINLNTEIRKLKDRIKDLEETNACLHETAKDEFIPKSKVKEIVEIYDSSKREFAKLPDGTEISLSDNADVIEYLRKILED